MIAVLESVKDFREDIVIYNYLSEVNSVFRNICKA